MMRRIIGVAGACLMTALAAVLVAPTSAHAAPSNDYGAIAWSPVKKTVAFAFGDSRAAAESGAMNNCLARGGSGNCVEFGWFYHAWGALATSSNGHVGYGFGWDTTSSGNALKAARRNAITGCQQTGGHSCHVVLEKAAAGVPGRGSGGTGPYFKNGRPNWYYAALGDSYSSGLGNPPYPYSSTCSESAKAYPVRLDTDVPTLGKLGFIACSGAVTDDFFTTGRNLSQLVSLVRLPNVLSVTLTIGGNDIGFGSIARACLNQTKDCYKAQQGAVNARINALAGQGSAKTPTGRQIHALTALLAEIHKAAPKARIFVAGYPRLFGTDPRYYPLRKFHDAPAARVCRLSTSVIVGDLFFRYDDAQWFDQTADRLNGVLASAVAKAGVPATFVSVRAAFTTHGYCDSGPRWFTPVNVISLNPGSAALHPTAAGQLAYERSLRAAEGV